MKPRIEAVVEFPKFAGRRCLMMPYVQGDPGSVPEEYAAYADIIRSVCIDRGGIGYLTIDESVATEGRAHRGDRAKHGRALHTEAGRRPGDVYAWGSSSPWTWGSAPPKPKPPVNAWGETGLVTLDRDVEILLANNVDESCAVWDAEHEDTSPDGDIGHEADRYPYSAASFLKAGEVWRIGILTPHESLPVQRTVNRQFLRIVGSGVHGREPYFTQNPLMPS